MGCSYAGETLSSVPGHPQGYQSKRETWRTHSCQVKPAPQNGWTVVLTKDLKLEVSGATDNGNKVN